MTSIIHALFSDESKVVPDPSDFLVHFVETRPGKPDPNTGIPPSLYTVRVSDFLLGPASVELKIERPVCANISKDKLLHIQAVLAELQDETFESTNQDEASDKSTNENAASEKSTNQMPGNADETFKPTNQEGEAEEELLEEKEMPLIVQTLLKVDSFHLTTVQLVVGMETKDERGQTAGVQVSIAGLQNQVMFRPDPEKSKPIHNLVFYLLLVFPTPA
jgi:hypothetical protein